MQMFKDVFLGLFLFSSVAFASYSVPNGSITTAKLATGAVTLANLSAANLSISTSSSGSFSTTSGSYVTAVSVSILTHGRPVLLVLQPHGTSILSYMGCSQPTGAVVNSNCTFSFFRGSSPLDGGRQFTMAPNSANSSGSSSTIQVPMGLTYLDVPGAGTTVYSVKATTNNSSTAYVVFMDLVAYEF